MGSGELPHRAVVARPSHACSRAALGVSQGRPVDEVMEEVRRIILKDVAGEAPGDPKAIAKGVKAQ